MCLCIFNCIQPSFDIILLFDFQPEHTNILHKRNAKLPGRKAHLLDRILNKRNKRFATLFVPLFELDDDDIVTYTDK